MARRIYMLLAEIVYRVLNIIVGDKNASQSDNARERNPKGTNDLERQAQDRAKSQG